MPTKDRFAPVDNLWITAVDNAAGNRLARQGQSELTGLLGPCSEAN